MAAHKTTKPERELIINRILAGDTNRQINQALDDAGYPTTLSDTSYTHYRNLDEVKKAIRERCDHLRQQGLGDRTRRVQKLSALANRLEKRIMDGRALDDADADDKLVGGGLFIADRLLATYQQINKEVGDDKTTIDIQASEDGLALLRGTIAKMKNGGRNRPGVSQEPVGMDSA